MSEFKNMIELKKAFYKTKKAVSNRLLPLTQADEDFIDGGYLYLDDRVWIGKLTDKDADALGGRYYLAIENQEWVDDDLSLIEYILLENWCRYEFLQYSYFDDDYRLQNEVNELMINESEENNEI